MKRILYKIFILVFFIGCGNNISNGMVDINSNLKSNQSKDELFFNKKISIEDKIAGLYIFYFNRAPDWDGFNYWKSRDYEDSEALNKLSLSFSQNEVFISTYSNLNNREFVEAIYQNVLGKDGDEEGILYWTNELDSGVSRSDMVSSFVEASLGSDLTKDNFPNLTEDELKDAQYRQD